MPSLLKQGKVLLMAQVLPGAKVNRWYNLRNFSKSSKDSGPVFAERYFDSHVEAFEYWEERSAELGPNRVFQPVTSHEDSRIWAVCVDVE